MGIRYRKSIRLGGGVRLNLSKSGFGMSMGIPGFRVGANSAGRTRRTMSIPGTGISSVSEGGRGRGRSSSSGAGRRTAAGGGASQVSIPAEQGLHLLPKPGWLASGADKRYYEAVQAYLKGEYPAALAAFRACLAAEPKGSIRPPIRVSVRR